MCVGKRGLLPAAVAERQSLANGAGAGYIAADGGGVIAFVCTLQVKWFNACSSLQQRLAIFQRQNVVGRAEGGVCA